MLKAVKPHPFQSCPCYQLAYNVKRVVMHWQYDCEVSSSYSQYIFSLFRLNLGTDSPICESMKTKKYQVLILFDKG
jgi:hypothetical protein